MHVYYIILKTVGKITEKNSKVFLMLTNKLREKSGFEKRNRKIKKAYLFHNKNQFQRIKKAFKNIIIHNFKIIFEEFKAQKPFNYFILIRIGILARILLSLNAIKLKNVVKKQIRESEFCTNPRLIVLIWIPRLHVITLLDNLIRHQGT